MRLRSSCFGVLTALLATSEAFAAGDSELELDYEADASCPSAPAFHRSVEQQLAEYDREGAAARGARARVRITAAAAGDFVATFEIVRGAELTARRELRGASCEEASSALAFVLALVVGGRDVEATGSAPTAASPAAPPERAASPPAAPASSPARARSVTTGSSVSSTPSHRLAWGFGLDAGARSGFADGLAPLARAHVRLERSAALWAWSSSLAFSRALSVTQVADSGRLSIDWWAAGIETCPLALGGLTSRLQPCAVAHLGRLAGQGFPEPLPGSSSGTFSELWADVGVALQSETQLAGPLWLSLRAEGLLPLTRYRFSFRPSTPVHRVPALAAAGFVGVRTRFP